MTMNGPTRKQVEEMTEEEYETELASVGFTRREEDGLIESRAVTHVW